MKCPVCKTPTLVQRTIDKNLDMLECSECGGNWLKSYQYWLWKAFYDGVSHSVHAEIEAKPENAEGIKICPECSRLLKKYAAGHGTGMFIDRCDNCRGIWFNKSEMNRLLKSDVHKEITAIFASHWQKQVRDEKVFRHRDELLLKELGETEYKLVRDFKNWIAKHPKVEYIISYINFTLRN